MITQQGSQQAGTRSGAPGSAIHWPRTLAQKSDQPLAHHHLRYQRRQARAGALHCLVLDCSASMLAGRNLALAKGLLQQWAQQIYRQRAHLCVIGFGGGDVRVLQTPRKAARINEHWITPIRGGGGTPVVQGLHQADQILAQARNKNPRLHTALWLLTDGRFPDLPPRPHHADTCAVVDFENAPVRLGRALQLAQHWQGDYALASDFLHPHSRKGPHHAH